MKIGILTIQFNNNYGGFLQAYALQYFLTCKGHDVTIINLNNNKLSRINKFKFIIKGIINTVLRFESFPVFKSIYEFKGKKMHTFVSKHIKLSKPFKDRNEYIKFCNNSDFNAFIVGSDQVWRPEYVKCIYDYFLDFINKDIFRISYAASFGTDNPNYSAIDIRLCGEYLSKFKAISVRETSAITVMEKFKWTTENVITVLDPTLLLPKSHYEKLIENYRTKICYKDRILSYILDDNDDIHNILCEAENTMKLKSINIINPEKWKNINYVMPAIEEWLCAFRDASFIITDSFHGMVFSIIMQKPFAVYINSDRGISRFTSLLSMLNLDNRIIRNNIGLLIHEKINWSEVNTLLDYQKKKSEKFITNSLN